MYIVPFSFQNKILIIQYPLFKLDFFLNQTIDIFVQCCVSGVFMLNVVIVVNPIKPFRRLSNY